MPAFPFVLNLDSLGPYGIRIGGGEAGGIAGRTLASAGDVNGDGLDDFLVGAPFSDGNGTDSGGAYLVYGRTDLDALTLTPGIAADIGIHITGEGAGVHAGDSLGGIGDINHDGFDDFGIGAVGGSSGNGAAYVLFGSESGLVSLTLTGNMSIATGFKINEAAAGDALTAIEGAGDINGDGVDDYIVGAPGNDAHGAGAGAAYVLFGKESGFATINLANLAAADGYRILGINAGDALGGHVQAIGDFNHDGFGDFAISAEVANGRGGAAYVLFGSETPGTVNLANLTAGQGFAINGSGFEAAGHSISSAGDINGDGFDDVIVGSYPGNGYGYPGQAYVIYGKETGIGTVTLSTLSAADGFTIVGSGQEEAGNAVSSAGDVNGDGFDDLIVGAPYGTDGDGVTYVVYGKNTPFGGELDLATFSASDGFKIVGNSGYTGSTVSAAGDVNGDGFADIMVSAEQENGSAGAAYIIFGQGTPNAAPSGADVARTILEDGSYTIQTADFGFTDSRNALLAVKITTLPAGGTLTNNGVAVSAGDLVAKTDIDANHLVFTPAANANGAGYGSFTFQVEDNGGTAGGGVNLDQSPNSFTINVTAVDDLPVAVADGATTFADTVSVINAVANDTDIDAGTKAVIAINGVALTVGDPKTLATGATVTLAADGTLHYDPNGAYDYLVSAATAAETHASDSTATDSFTYTLNGGSTATVTVTINGVDGPDDELRGTTGNDDLVISGDPNFIDGGAGTNSVTITSGSTVAIDDGQVVNIRRFFIEDGAHLDFSGAHSTAFTINSLSTAGSGSELIGSQGADKLYGGQGADTLSGGDGNDRLAIYTTPALVDGGDDIDKLTINAGGTAILTDANFRNVELVLVKDGAFLDMSGVTIAPLDIRSDSTSGQTVEIIGTAGKDHIVGGAGNDILAGGLATDAVTGGLGADTFLFQSLDDISKSHRKDFVTDFHHGEGDKIDLSAIDPDGGAPGNQSFTFIGTAAFTGTGGSNYELRVSDDHSGTLAVQGDINHDGAVDFTIMVRTADVLQGSDFVL